MLSRKVIATDITNLTDARYFAARGVDYLLFDMSNTPLLQIIEIKEWVEGPKLLLLFDINSLPLLDEAIIKLMPTGISGKSSSEVSEISHLSAHVEIFSWEKDLIEVEHQEFKRINRLDELSTLQEDIGIIMSGSLEDEIGVKAFDELDEILDVLEFD